MGQFKPMVKMETTEPSVILKLKKGGSAHKKMQGDAKSGHKMMDGGMPMDMSALTSMAPKIAPRSAAPVSRMPARPSMASRRKAMLAAKSAQAPMKKGGKACYAEGGAVASSGNIPVSASKKGAQKYVNGDISTAEHTTKTSGKTGDVKFGNGGGYKTGGVVLGNGGGYKTGGVALGQGGYKKGGAPKKAYANGGSVNDEGKAVSMPQGNKKPSTPVSISKLSGTFKKGGNVSSKKLQGFFKKENATAMKESKAKLLDKYSPYQKADGGPASDKEFDRAMTSYKLQKQYKKEAGLGNVSEKDLEKIRKYSPSDEDIAMAPSQARKRLMEMRRQYDERLSDLGNVSDNERLIASEKKYPSGLTDSDIDKVISSKEVQEGMSHFVDKKRGGKVKK